MLVNWTFIYCLIFVSKDYQFKLNFCLNTNMVFLYFQELNLPKFAIFNINMYFQYPILIIIIIDQNLN